MTRIALIADSHFDSSSRFDECVRVHSWIAEDVARRGVDLILHSGDVFERRSNPEERRAVAEWLSAMAEIAPVVIVRGNHDALGDLSIFSRLRTKHPIIVEEACGVHVVAGVAVACMAWPRKAQLLAGIGARSHEESDADARAALELVLRGLGQQLAEHDGPRVLLAHAMVRGSRVSTGQPLVGCDLEVGVLDLGLVGADFLALGHIHMPQEWGVTGAPVVYPGSPRRTAFGEVEEKGYVIAEIEDRAVRWERIPTPCAPMLLLAAEYAPPYAVDPHGDVPECRGALAWHAGPPEDVRGAEIRLRYLVQTNEREAARRLAEDERARLLERGAVVVKLEEVVVASTIARAPEVAEARSTWAQLEAHWRARGEEHGEARREGMRGKLAQVEERAA